MQSKQEREARKALKARCDQMYASHGKLLLKGATGSGKTKIALELIDKTPGPWEVIVPKTSLIKEWHNEMDRWKLSRLKKRVTVYCYDSLHKHQDECNLVLDEAHRLTPLKFPMVEHKVDPLRSKVIALSATIPRERMDLLKALGIDRKHQVTYRLDQAVKDNVVAPYSVTVIHFPLDDEKKIIEAGNKFNKFFVTEKQNYEWTDKYFRRMLMTKNQKAIEIAVRKRMHCIYNLPSKVRVGKLALNMIPEDKKTLIFAGSIAHANLLCKHRYHSKTSDEDFESFKEGRILRLSAVGQISEGVNIPNLEVALILQVQSNMLHMIQKTGRLLRKTNDPNKIGHVIVLCAMRTQDEKWVDSSLRDFNPANVEHKLLRDVMKNGIPGLGIVPDYQ